MNRRCNKKMKRKLIAGILALALGVTTAFAMVAAQTNSSGPVSMGVDGRLDGPCEMSQLTDEEREEIQQQLHEYQQDLLEQYGINLTVEQRGEIRRAMQGQQQEMRQQMEEFRKELFAQYGIDLTDEEREEIRQQMEEYREELFEGYGVSCPAGPQCAGGEGNGPRGHMGTWIQGFQRDFDFSELPPTPPDLEI